MLFDVQTALYEILAATAATPATIATNTLEPPSLSRVSRLSQAEAVETKTRKTPVLSTRTTIIKAIRAGLKTPGSIATAAKLGATDTYQELDRMALEGLVTMQGNGALGLIASPSTNGPTP